MKEKIYENVQESERKQTMQILQMEQKCKQVKKQQQTVCWIPNQWK